MQRLISVDVGMTMVPRHLSTVLKLLPSQANLADHVVFLPTLLLLLDQHHNGGVGKGGGLA